VQKKGLAVFGSWGLPMENLLVIIKKAVTKREKGGPASYEIKGGK